MRKDMFKVIVERPRRGRHWHREVPEPRDLECAPDHESLRERHQRRKSLNENLRPLKRFLASQVGRPWDKVYSGVCANIDRRSTVQQHIHEHLGDFVAIRVVEIDGIAHCAGRWGEPSPLAARWAPEYWVHPRTGLLCRNEARVRTRAQEDRAWEQKTTDRLDHRRDVGELKQLHRLRGLWYEVELALLPRRGHRNGAAYDVLRRAPVARADDARPAAGHVGGDEALFGRYDVYAFAKRALSSRELRHHGLCNREPDQ